MKLRPIARAGDGPSAPHFAILLSVAAAFVFATAASIFEMNSLVVSLQEDLNLRKKTESIEVISAKLLASVEDLEGKSAQNHLKKYISENSPSEIYLLLKFLFSKNDKNKYGKFAIELAIQAANRYKDRQLYLILASEYMKGTSVDINFDAAWKFLDKPNMKDDRSADYYRGLWWLDKLNPKMDLVIAKFYLQKSAANGLVAASKILFRLEK